MLQLEIKPKEEWDENAQEFIYTKGQTLQLEHSLVSISKWESKWCKPFLGKESKTYEETIDYIRCMTLTQNVNPKIYTMLSAENIMAVNNYIEAPMSATFLHESENKRPSREAITSELIYYWMISYQIPFECQKWHLNRLLMLIRVCSVKNTPVKKRSARDIMNQNAALNAARRKQYNTKG